MSRRVRIWWVNGQRGNWDHGLLMHLAERYRCEEVVSDTLDVTDGRGAIIVASGPQGLKLAAGVIAKLPWAIFIHASDEGMGYDSSVLRSPTVRTWVQYARQDRCPADRRLPIGAPYDTEILVGTEQNPRLPTCDRKWLWAFGGQPGGARRQACIAALRARSDGDLLVTKGFGQGRTRTDHMHALSQARIALCPPGPHSPDSFRLYEALEAGCLPICDRRGEDWPATAQSYWVHVLGFEPFPCVDDWSELPALLDTFAADPKLLQERTDAAVAWWQGYKAEVGRDLMAQVFDLSGGREGIWYDPQERPVEVNCDLRLVCTNGVIMEGRVGTTDQSVFSELLGMNTYRMERSWFEGSGVVLDIGANIGAAARQALSLGAKRVVCYEPDRLNFAMLLRNAEGFPIRCHRLAVGGARGVETLVMRGAGSSLEFCRVLNTYTVGAGQQKTQVVTLQDVFEEDDLAGVDLLKLDCEGAEYEIVDMAPAAILQRCRRIVIETHALDGADPQAFGRLLSKLSLTHKLRVEGKYTSLAQIWAEVY